MSNQGRALISALNRGDHQSVDQYDDLSDQDIKIVNHHVHELFERAIRTENFKLFLALIKIPRVKVSGSEYCALRHATRMGLVEYVSQLARVKSANANLQDKQGNTALIYAVAGKWNEKKAFDLVRAIMMSGTMKANLRGTNKKTPLHFALEKDWFEVADALMDAGAHPAMEDDAGKTPLFMALTGDIPSELFSRMLSYEGDPPEEYADEIVEDDVVEDLPTDGATPLASAEPGKNSPGVQAISPKSKDPIIRSVDTQVDIKSDKDDQVAEPVSIPDLASTPLLAEDQAKFSTVMEGQELDESLSKHFLFSAAEDDPRMRIHRTAVLERLDDIQKALELNGHGLNSEDARKKDPETGLTLWHLAAAQDQFTGLIALLADKNDWPAPADFAALAPDGRSLASILEDNSSLQSVLNAPMWNAQPGLLTALLSGLPVARRGAFSQLISRANLMLLYQKVR